VSMANIAGVHRWPGTPEAYLMVQSHLGDRRALARELRLDSDASDEELVAAAYHRWGVDCAAHFVGPFGFAIWDPSTGLFILGRDHTGQAPLFFASTSDAVVFGTDIEDVLAHPDVSDEVDLEAVALYEARVFRPMLRRSFFKGIRKVEPGTVVTFKPNSRLVHRYWRPEEVEVEEGRSVEDCAAELRELLQVCVADALPPDAKIGAHLSGGLDSSAIAVIADEELKRQGRRLEGVFSWAPTPTGPIPPSPDLRNLQDERWLVELVCQQQGWSPVYSDPDLAPLPAVAGLDPLLFPPGRWWREGEVANNAKHSGISVLLSGWGGDELISHNGRSKLAHLLRCGRLGQTWSESKKRALVTGTSSTTILGSAVMGCLPENLIGRVRSLALNPSNASRSVHRESERMWRVLSPKVANELRKQRRQFGACVSPHDLQITLLHSGYVTRRLESFAKYGSQLQVDYRYPLLDPRIMELALRASDGCYLSEGTKRRMFRIAVAHALPGPVVENPFKVEPALTTAGKRHRSLRTATDSRSTRWAEATAILNTADRVNQRRREAHQAEPASR